jgi:hypothetical protein
VVGVAEVDVGAAGLPDGATARADPNGDGADIPP